MDRRAEQVSGQWLCWLTSGAMQELGLTWGSQGSRWEQGRSVPASALSWFVVDLSQTAWHRWYFSHRHLCQTIKSSVQQEPSHFLASQNALFVASNVFRVRWSGLSSSLSLFNLAFLHNFTFFQEELTLYPDSMDRFCKDFPSHSFCS